MLPRLLLILPPVFASTWLANGPVYYEGKGQVPSQCTQKETYAHIDDCVRGTSSSITMYTEILDTKSLDTTDHFGCVDPDSSAVRVALPLNIFNSAVVWPNVTLRLGIMAEPSIDCQFSNFAVGLARYPAVNGCGPIITEDVMIAVRKRPPAYLGRQPPTFRWDKLDRDQSMLKPGEKIEGTNTPVAVTFEINTFLGNRTLGEAVGLVIQPTVSTCSLTFLSSTTAEVLKRIQIRAFSRIDGQFDAS